MLKDDCIFQKKKKLRNLCIIFFIPLTDFVIKRKQKSIIDPNEETIMKLRALIINFKPLSNTLSNTLLQLFCVFTMFYIIQVIMKF